MGGGGLSPGLATFKVVFLRGWEGWFESAVRLGIKLWFTVMGPEPK